MRFVVYISQSSGATTFRIFYFPTPPLLNSPHEPLFLVNDNAALDSRSDHSPSRRLSRSFPPPPKPSAPRLGASKRGQGHQVYVTDQAPRPNLLRVRVSPRPPFPEANRKSRLASGWDFFAWDDPSHGNVQYESRENSGDIAYVQADGVAVVKVDNQSPVPAGGKRRSCVTLSHFNQPPIGSVRPEQCPHHQPGELQRWSLYCRLLGARPWSICLARLLE